MDAASRNSRARTARRAACEAGRSAYLHAMGNPVEHLESEHRFQMSVDGEAAVVDYAEQEGVWLMTHTYVPSRLRGGGIAAALVKYALDTAREKNKKVSPLCSYVEAYITRHPEYRDLVAVG